MNDELIEAASTMGSFFAYPVNSFPIRKPILSVSPIQKLIISANIVEVWPEHLPGGRFHHKARQVRTLAENMIRTQAKQHHEHEVFIIIVDLVS